MPPPEEWADEKGRDVHFFLSDITKSTKSSHGLSHESRITITTGVPTVGVPLLPLTLFSPDTCLLPCLHLLTGQPDFTIP